MKFTGERIGSTVLLTFSAGDRVVELPVGVDEAGRIGEGLVALASGACGDSLDRDLDDLLDDEETAP